MTERPDPDALLAQITAQEGRVGQGSLKVYLGMAAGVGKTYAMLSQAREAAKRGVDVVIGYLEPQGRPETEAMAEGLERIPPISVEYRGITLHDFDLDAAIARRPQLLLVDELAHTNVAGLRHKKRWQDVEEVLAAGIDVATSVNVQHLESLNDVVAQITGIVVTETVPDLLIEEAKDVELIDLPPEELIRRLNEGKIYKSEQIGRAIEGFFKTRNLTALREIALRKTAERVDEQVRAVRAAEGTKQTWKTTERILACIAPNSHACHVLREASRLAAASHADMMVATVFSVQNRRLSTSRRHCLDEAMALAATMGAHTTSLVGDDIAGTLSAFAREHNVTTIVVGKSLRPRWKEAIQGGVVDAVIRQSGVMNVHVITGEDTPVERSRGAANGRRQTDWRGMQAAVVVTVITSSICWVMYKHVSAANLIMVYLLGVTYVASRYQRVAALLASALAVLCYDVMFVPPRGTFAVSDVEYVITLGVMLVVAFVVSSLTSRLREEMDSSGRRERRAAALYELSRRLSSTRHRTELGRFAADQVRMVFNCDAAVFVRSRKTGELFPGPESQTGFEKEANEMAVARWVLDHAKPAGKGTDTLPGSEGLYLPLQGDQGPVGVLAVKWRGAPERDLRMLHLLEIFANQLAVAIERTNLAKDANENALQIEGERLRNALLNSVSHDLRTPLAVISGAAEQLRGSETMTAPRDKELASAIADESGRLERQVRNLLDMTRLGAGAIDLRREWQAIEELVGSALLRTDALLGDREVHTMVPANLPFVALDGALIEQVFVNILENAARYTPIGASVWVTARAVGNTVEIEFANDGPSLSEDELTAIFDKFVRGAEARGPGSGLGLAICKAIVQAHGGSIAAMPRKPSGVRFVVTLPVPEDAPEAPRG